MRSSSVVIKDDLSDHSGAGSFRHADSDYDSNESDTLNDDDDADIDDDSDHAGGRAGSDTERKPSHPLDLTRK